MLTLPEIGQTTRPHRDLDPALDEIGFCAWVALAQPGETLVYHRGFLAVDVMPVFSKLTIERQDALRDLAAAAWRAADHRLVHLVQARLGVNHFAYIAIARPKPKSQRRAPAKTSLRAL